MAPLKNRPDLEAAVEHIRWVSKWQHEGYILLATMRGADRRFVERFWIHNRNSLSAIKVRRFLRRHADESLTFLYSASSFSKKTKAVYANHSRLAFVDADRSPLPAPGPSPTRIVESSPGNHHFFWVLSRPVSPTDLQNINKALTRMVAGDKGGHSPAKLFRLPGTLNCKPSYEPPPLVRVVKHRGRVHDTAAMLALIKGQHARLIEGQMDASVLDEARELRAAEVRERFRRHLHPFTRARLRQRKVYGRLTLRVAGRSHTYPGDDRSQVIWSIGVDLRSAGASPAEVLAVMRATCFWRAREFDGKAEPPSANSKDFFRGVRQQQNMSTQKMLNWTNNLLRRGQTPISNLANALTAFREAPEWVGVLRYDEFGLRTMAMRPPPWAKHKDNAWQPTLSDRPRRFPSLRNGCSVKESTSTPESFRGDRGGGEGELLPPCPRIPSIAQVGWDRARQALR